VPLRRSADGAMVADWGQVPARVYVAGLAGDGRRTMTACLEAIAAWVSGGAADIDTLAWARLRFAHTTAIRAAQAPAVNDGRYAPATANKHLAALRGALKAAWRMGVMETDEYMRAVDLRPIGGSRLPAGRDVERSELAVLLAQCRADETPAGVRDGAVIGLAYLSGTRRAELVALHLADVDTEPAAIRVVARAASSGWCPSPPLSVRSSSSGWSSGAIPRARSSAPSTAGATCASATPSAARPSARSSPAAPWPPAWPLSRPMTCAGPTPVTSSTPARTCPRSSS